VSLEDAQAKSRAIGARLTELIAALRLSQLEAGSVARRAAVQDLYDTFTESFDTPILQEARAWVASETPVVG
jgi:hypothetical protein